MCGCVSRARVSRPDMLAPSGADLSEEESLQQRTRSTLAAASDPCSCTFFSGVCDRDVFLRIANYADRAILPT